MKNVDPADLTLGLIIVLAVVLLIVGMALEPTP